MTPLDALKAAQAADRAVPKPVKRGAWRTIKAWLGLEKPERDPELRKAAYRAEGERQRGER